MKSSKRVSSRRCSVSVLHGNAGCFESFRYCSHENRNRSLNFSWKENFSSPIENESYWLFFSFSFAAKCLYRKVNERWVQQPTIHSKWVKTSSRAIALSVNGLDGSPPQSLTDPFRTWLAHVKFKVNFLLERKNERTRMKWNNNDDVIPLLMRFQFRQTPFSFTPSDDEAWSRRALNASQILRQRFSHVCLQFCNSSLLLVNKFRVESLLVNGGNFWFLLCLGLVRLHLRLIDLDLSN